MSRRRTTAQHLESGGHDERPVKASFAGLAQKLLGASHETPAERPATPGFGAVMEKLLRPTIETRGLLADYRTTHAVMVDFSGRVLRVLCERVPIEAIDGFNKYSVPTCPHCVRIDALPVTCPMGSRQWLNLELRRLAATPMKTILEADEAAARVERERREAREQWLAQRRDAVEEAAELLAVPYVEANDDHLRRTKQLLPLLPAPQGGELVGWYNRALRARHQAWERPSRATMPERRPASPPPMVPAPRADNEPAAARIAGSLNRPAVYAARPTTIPLNPDGRGSSEPGKSFFPRPAACPPAAREEPRSPERAGSTQGTGSVTLPTAASARSPREEVLPRPAGRGSSGPGKRLFPPATALREEALPGAREQAPPGVGRGGPLAEKPVTTGPGAAVAPPKDDRAGTAHAPLTHPEPSAPATSGSDLAERILAVVKTGTYMSANRIAQALREQGDGARTQTVFATVATMFGDQRLMKVNDVIRPGPAAGR
jgi:hypothetical protein